jgi:FkbM family methyltransferase
MHLGLKGLVKESLKKFDIGITKYSRLKELERRTKGSDVVELLGAYPDRNDARLLKAMLGSRSQLWQDLFVLCELNFKEGGFFVEFGATDGVNLSNSHLLEKEFGWSGIVAEPARRWVKDLKANRKCNIETNCVWRESNAALIFNETDLGEYSTVDEFSSADTLNKLRVDGRSYSVSTISLNDMLEKYNAPRRMDYLSIDTEGSEYDILNSLDFDKYQFSVITCEHNFAPLREKLFALLSGHGYVRKLEAISLFDDWYVRAE